MRKVLSGAILLFIATASFAADSYVSWNRIVGVITAPGVPNPVAGIAAGGVPWSAAAGSAVVDLTNGDIAFSVTGLVLVGGNSAGTPGAVTTVKGTLVCSPGTATQTVIDTATVPLTPEGNASFKGTLATAPPSSCDTPLFLIRAAAANVWIATGAVRTTSP